jgi:hypothetical protein
MKRKLLRYIKMCFTVVSWELCMEILYLQKSSIIMFQERTYHFATECTSLVRPRIPHKSRGLCPLCLETEAADCHRAFLWRRRPPCVEKETSAWPTRAISQTWCLFEQFPVAWNCIIYGLIKHNVRFFCFFAYDMSKGWELLLQNKGILCLFLEANLFRQFT